jgi:hypothetical protein
LYGEYLYLMTDSGIVTCMDPRTGEIKYEGKRVPKPGRFNSAMIAFDGKFLLSSEDGDTYVIKAGPSSRFCPRIRSARGSSRRWHRQGIRFTSAPSNRCCASATRLNTQTCAIWRNWRGPNGRNMRAPRGKWRAHAHCEEASMKRLWFFAALLAVCLLATVAVVPAQQPTEANPLPMMNTIEPRMGGDRPACDHHRKEPGKRVAGVYLTDGKKDWKMTVVEQTETKIVAKVAEKTPGGRFRLMAITTDDPGQYVEQPLVLDIIFIPTGG